MNRLENWFCATNFWRNVTQRHLLSWMLQGIGTGGDVLELGAGPGAATGFLLQKFSSVTSLEFSAAFASSLARQSREPSPRVVQGDAAQLPFVNETFHCVIAILMLHHLPSAELQAAALSEACRVLRPDGVFLAFEIHDGWLQRLIHTRSTFVPFAASSANARLNAAGFSRASVDFRRGGFLMRAHRRDQDGD
ncbi:MAG TPA: class I SAM-dependent methyltransferase [Candidatus Dormibacteraeota bacterium]|nr:class I SAM-dependent methyltransferase [Candidatus Dormibacteraeota bacterium]